MCLYDRKISHYDCCRRTFVNSLALFLFLLLQTNSFLYVYTFTRRRHFLTNCPDIYDAATVRFHAFLLTQRFKNKWRCICVRWQAPWQGMLLRVCETLRSTERCFDSSDDAVLPLRSQWPLPDLWPWPCRSPSVQTAASLLCTQTLNIFISPINMVGWNDKLN